MGAHPVLRSGVPTAVRHAHAAARGDGRHGGEPDAHRRCPGRLCDAAQPQRRLRAATCRCSRCRASSSVVLNRDSRALPLHPRAVSWRPGVPVAARSAESRLHARAAPGEHGQRAARARGDGGVRLGFTAARRRGRARAASASATRCARSPSTTRSMMPRARMGRRSMTGQAGVLLLAQQGPALHPRRFRRAAAHDAATCACWSAIPATRRIAARRCPGVEFLGPLPQAHLHAEVRSALCTFFPELRHPGDLRAGVRGIACPRHPGADGGLRCGARSAR